jgi:myo-inositol-1(or 4)-monophosphatase
MTAGALVDFYLPRLATAGDYALAIQPAVARSHGQRLNKHGHNDWVAALTDADLSVQNYLEVETLAHHPSVSFYGEEHERSHNQRYFPVAAEWSVHLDPVNGTFLYQRQRRGWDIVLSIARHGVLAAAISYMPWCGRYHVAVRDRGAFQGDRGAPRLASMAPLRTGAAARTCHTYQAPELKARLGAGFAVYDIVADDDPARGLDNLNELFSGRLGAFACRGGECLDWGVAAFIAVAAGGAAAGFDGAPLGIFDRFDPRGHVDMIVAADAATLDEILGQMRG